MRHFTAESFWERFGLLPPEVRRLATKNYRLLRRDPRHGSLAFKRVGRYWSVRVGLGHRAVGVPVEGGVLWFWIGDHGKYERLIRG